MGAAESKLSFKTRVFHLASADEIASDDPYWQMFWTTPESVDDIFNLLTVDDINFICTKNTTNFLRLIRIVSYKFLSLSSKKQFPHPSLAPTSHLLNCTRLLTRLLPFLFENPDFNDYETLLFWSKGVKFDKDPNLSLASAEATVGTLSPNPNVSPTNIPKSSLLFSHIQALPQSPLSPPSSQQESTHSSTSLNVNIDSPVFEFPLGAQLVFACVRLLFTRHFTISPPDNTVNRNLKGVDFTIWEPGIGNANSKYSDPSTEIDANRLDVLRLLLTLCSQCLYISPVNLVSKGSRFLTVLVTSTPKLQLLTLLCSLINLICRSCKLKDSNNTNGLHYQSSPLLELRHSMVTYSFELFTLMLVYPIPKDTLFLKQLGIYDPSYNPKSHNIVRFFLSKLHKKNELIFLITHLLTFLKQPMLITRDNELSAFAIIKRTTNSNISDPPIWSTEILMIIWELFQCNKNFRQCLVTLKNFSNELIITLLYYIITFQNSESHKNIVRLTSYLVLYLSSNKDVCLNLLNPITMLFYNQLPSSFKPSPNPITYRDLIVIKISKLLINEPELSRNILMPTYIEWLYNLIPIAIPMRYTPPNDTTTNNNEINNENENNNENNDLIISSINKASINPGGGLSDNAATSITQVIIKLSQTRFLLASSMNPDLLALIVRAICNAICRYPKQSRTLIFIIVKNARIYNSIYLQIKNTATKKQESSESISQILKMGLPRTGSNLSVNTNNSLANNNNTNDHNSIHSLSDSNSLKTNSRNSSVISLDSIVNNDYNDDNNNNNNNNSTDHLESIEEFKPLNEIKKEEEEIDSALRPAPPSGMSAKAKGKLPADAPLYRTWSGLASLKIILKFIELIRKNINNFDDYKVGESIALLKSIEIIPDIEEKISKIASAEYLPATNLPQLKFLWSNVSLGWYESILWGQIYRIDFNLSIKLNNKDISETISNTFSGFGFGGFGKNNNTNLDADENKNKNRNRNRANANGNNRNSFGDGIWSLAKWTTTNPDAENIEIAKKTLTNINVYNGTNIKLFRLKSKAKDFPTLLQPRGAVDAVADTFLKKITDFRLGNNELTRTNSLPAFNTQNNTTNDNGNNSNRNSVQLNSNLQQDLKSFVEEFQIAAKLAEGTGLLCQFKLDMKYINENDGNNFAADRRTRSVTNNNYISKVYDASSRLQDFLDKNKDNLSAINSECLNVDNVWTDSEDEEMIYNRCIQAFSKRKINQPINYDESHSWEYFNLKINEFVGSEKGIDAKKTPEKPKTKEKLKDKSKSKFPAIAPTAATVDGSNGKSIINRDSNREKRDSNKFKLRSSNRTPKSKKSISNRNIKEVLEDFRAIERNKRKAAKERRERASKRRSLLEGNSSSSAIEPTNSTALVKISDSDSSKNSDESIARNPSNISRNQNSKYSSGEKSKRLRNNIETARLKRIKKVNIKLNNIKRNIKKGHTLYKIDKSENIKSENHKTETNNKSNLNFTKPEIKAYKTLDEYNEYIKSLEFQLQLQKSNRKQLENESGRKLKKFKLDLEVLENDLETSTNLKLLNLKRKLSDIDFELKIEKIKSS
ncbi:Ecm30p ASCRUDRAFT_6391 [Ascoidea rubescens DSM 1968]|uniref:Uncharacterized protein n=1 Tax=Ascoidea rubescens DSM 1968 TaxID=1344418 RepID=A0A1D2VM75_9ASCO|nr:hypothetical protein ASCRUDRAFT_6391 [Ascoidea rubescens DSM 1968]ODV62718.1 hypothetical protein ASCRUDRAFT_6391 [Ascoidea rubescens DSM 1968]